MTDTPETRYGEDERRCHAVLEDGSRCPNPAEPGQPYCGLPDHQALADADSDRIVAPLADGDPDGVALDESAEEVEAGEEAGAIGGMVGDEPAGEDGGPAPAERPVIEGGGEDAAGQEQSDSALRAAAEDAVEPDLTADGQGFDDPDRRP